MALDREPECFEPPLLGRSAASRAARERLVALAPLDVPVLLEGEPGTGRDAAARTLHRLSGVAGPLVRVRGGVREARAVGCAYLDEVARLPLACQSEWLEWRHRASAPRLVASTSESLADAVRAGRLLEELARWLGRFRVQLHPLRERRADVAEIARALAGPIAHRLGRERVHLDAGAAALLRGQAWPGNVRQVAETLERAVAFSRSGRVTAAGLRAALCEGEDVVGAERARREERQRAELMGLLGECGGNLAEVARRLHLSRGAVIYRAEKYGLRRVRRKR